MKRYVLIFLFVVATGFVLKAVWKTGWDMGRQYEGVCLETGKRLTDEEKIRAVIKELNRSPSRVVNGKSYQTIPYASVDVFLKENPNCCRVEIQENYYNGDSRNFAKATGGYAGHVFVLYTLHYLDENGKEQKKQDTINYGIQNCGIVD